MRGAPREHTSYANLDEARVVHSDYGAMGAAPPSLPIPPAALPPP